MIYSVKLFANLTTTFIIKINNYKFKKTASPSGSAVRIHGCAWWLSGTEPRVCAAIVPYR